MITSQGALSRHITEYLTDARVKHYKCKTLQNPDYFFDGRSFGAVDVSHKLDTSTEKAGGLFLRSKGIVSVGTKKTDDAYKLFGLRPDENQSGDQSVEWSVEYIEINGKAQTINLRDRLEVSPITTKFGDNLFVQRARQRCRIMVPGDSSTESFKLVFRLHLKGCTVEYRKDLDEYWIYRGGTFFCRLGKPYLVDPETMNPIQDADGTPYPQLVKHSLVEISRGEYRYTKEPTEAFALAGLPASYLIDADTVYSSTADGYVYYSNADWATCKAGTTGTGVSASATSYSAAMTAGKSGATFYIMRSFFYYSLAGVSGTVLSCSENLRGVGTNPSSCCIQKGTQNDTLGTEDYDAFSGSAYGNTSSWNTSDYNAITYSSAGCSDVQTAEGSVLKTCCREFTKDYGADSEPTAWTNTNGTYYADDTSGTKDPYLYITTGAVASSYIHGIMGHHFIPSFIGGR